MKSRVVDAVRRPHRDSAAIAANDSISRGMEIAGTVAVFTFVGLAVDRAAGTTPWLMLALFILGLVGQFVRSYYVYTTAMSVHEKQRTEMSRSHVNAGRS